MPTKNSKAKKSKPIKPKKSRILRLPPDRLYYHMKMDQDGDISVQSFLFLLYRGGNGKAQPRYVDWGSLDWINTKTEAREVLDIESMYDGDTPLTSSSWKSKKPIRIKTLDGIDTVECRKSPTARISPHSFY
jgi:hypothetical protein